MILSWANGGGKNASPAVLAALGTAAKHVAAEAEQVDRVHGADALAVTIAAEAQILQSTLKFLNLDTSATRLLVTLHARVAVARQLRVPACAGVKPVSALRPAAQG